MEAYEEDLEFSDYGRGHGMKVGLVRYGILVAGLALDGLLAWAIYTIAR